MSKPYTPTTEQVREWCVLLDHSGNKSRDEYAAEFDRWLANVQAEAWDQGYAVGHANGFGDGTQPDQRANPYRKER